MGHPAQRRPGTGVLWLRRTCLAGQALAAAAAVCAVGVSPWLSASHSNTTSELSGGGSSPGYWSGERSRGFSSSSGPLVLQSCESSAGLVPFPTSLPSGWSVAPWVPSSPAPECLQVDGSALVPPAPSPEPEPSNLPDTTTSDALGPKLDRGTDLLLYSGGLGIFLLAVIAFRARR